MALRKSLSFFPTGTPQAAPYPYYIMSTIFILLLLTFESLSSLSSCLPVWTAAAFLEYLNRIHHSRTSKNFYLPQAVFQLSLFLINTASTGIGFTFLSCFVYVHQILLLDYKLLRTGTKSYTSLKLTAP